MLRVEKLEAFYGNAAALKGVSVKVPEGGIVSIIGTNGAGKTTLLKSISGIGPVTKGAIRFGGEEINGKPPSEIVAMGISLVPEGRQLFSPLTVRDNLELGAYLFRSRRNRRRNHDKLEEVLATFPILKERYGQIAGTLSGGEQQMLAIGRAMMARPSLLLLDEPSLGLAPLIVEQIFVIIKKLNKAGTTILLVEQNARMALQISDYAYVLETGSGILEGSGKKLAGDPNVQKAYLGIS